MGEPKEEGTEQASIRPVSSLRSLFEKKPGTDLASSTPSALLSPRSSARSDQRQDGLHTPARASLDVPRTNSPWSAAETVADPQRKGTPGPPVPRPRRPNSRILQRPLSTTSLSAPQPPLVTLSSPKSPPKPSAAIGEQGFAHSPILRPLSHSTDSESPHMVPTIPRRLGGTLSIKVERSTSEARNGSPETAPASTLINDIHSQQHKICRPPPVNRAEKPKVPLKSASMPSKAGLMPHIPATSERVSPFSTPPSSDESIAPDDSKSSKRCKPEVRKRNVKELGQSVNALSMRLQSMHEGHRALERDPISRAQNPDVRSFGFTHSSDLPSVGSEAPPSLPPRRAQDQRVPSLQSSEGNPRKSQMEANAILSTKSSTSQAASDSQLAILPPPKRAPIASHTDLSYSEKARVPNAVGDCVHSLEEQEAESSTSLSSSADYPDSSSANRRCPFIKHGIEEIDTGYDAKLVDICGRHVATTGHFTRVWDVVTGEPLLSLGHGEKEGRVTSLAFKPAAKASEEGSSLWLGTNYGDIEEVNIRSQNRVYVKTGAHERREIVKIYRHQNSMWTLDDGGRLCVWSGDESGLPDLQRSPISYRVPKGHTFSIVVLDNLWLATGKDIRVFRPSASEGSSFSVLHEPLSQPGIGAVTSGAIIGGQLDRVYFGHADGKVTIYSVTDFTCIDIVNISVYKISCLAGAGFHLWAGYSTGIINVFDTRTRPWTTKKDWLAHSNPTLNILVDRSGLWKDGILRVVSLGADNTLRFWDGSLEDDWLENDMKDHDVEYCTFRELTALVMTWNAGATTPTHLRYNEVDSRFFQDVLRADHPSDLLVFGFQELVDLEDKKLTAKNLFKGNKRKDPSEQEHMSRQYRAWRDHLVRCIEDTLPSNEPYHLLHTASMVGLFSCVFIRASQRNRISNLNTAEIKRGMGGLHGNKGALVLRFVLDDSSICLVNCHLAAGQSQTANRNNDVTAILDSELLPRLRTSHLSNDILTSGGDGSMVMDHEICILNGDLNYRIDTMGRDTVIKAVNASNISKLLERDQLLVSRRRHPELRIRAFKECPITFAPTYKYDVGSDRYDTSEKRRAPAWCDRILYRGPGKVKQIDYRRHDLRVSDHRPVSGRFRLRIKTIMEVERARVWTESEQRFKLVKGQLAIEAKVEYLRDVLGVPPNEARRVL